MSRLDRVLEPEVMDTAAEALAYDRMDHTAVNMAFVDDLIAAAGEANDLTNVLDLGTGTALIPIELCRRAPVRESWRSTPQPRCCGLGPSTSQTLD
ncbi:MAG: hypothetical protein R3C10_04605 [Pirellulales bacterium]